MTSALISICLPGKYQDRKFDDSTPALAGGPYRFTTPYGYAAWSQPWGNTQRVYYDNTGGYGWQPWPRYGFYQYHPAYPGPVYSGPVLQGPWTYGTVPMGYAGSGFAANGYYVPAWVH